MAILEVGKDNKEAENQLAKVIPFERKRWEKLCCIPPRYAEATFENFDKSRQPEAFEVMLNYDWHEGKSLVLFSPKTYGVGKTHLVCALLHKITRTDTVAKILPRQMRDGLTGASYSDYQVITLPCPIRFSTETELIARIKATFNSGNAETEEMVFSELMYCGLLVIDDVGKVKPRDLSFLQSVYYRIIDGRYGQMLPIIITTNLDVVKLEEHLGGACADRLVQMCGKNFVRMAGKSYRETD